MRGKNDKLLMSIKYFIIICYCYHWFLLQKMLPFIKLSKGKREELLSNVNVLIAMSVNSDGLY